MLYSRQNITSDGRTDDHGSLDINHNLKKGNPGWSLDAKLSEPPWRLESCRLPKVVVAL